MTEFLITIHLRASNEKNLYDWLIAIDEAEIDIASEVTVRQKGA